MRLLRTTLAAALLAVLAGTPATAVGSQGPERFQVEPQMKVERVSSLGLASTGGLNVALQENCGATPDDGVLVVGQACAVTIAVTDSNGLPVSGATLVSTRLPSDAATNADGLYSTTLTINQSAVVYVDVSHGGQTGQVHFYSVFTGRGLLFVEMTDRHGAALTDWSAAVGVDAWGTSWFPSNEHGLSVNAGTGRIAVTADLGTGEGYVLHAAGIQIPDGGRVTVALDGQNSHLIQASVGVNTSGSVQNVFGARIFATRSEQSPLRLRSGVLSNADGNATLHVSPGTYDVAALGGNPGIFVEAQGVDVSTQAANLPLAVESDLTLEWFFNPLTAPTEKQLVVTGALGGQHPLIQADPITLHMAPGSYQLVTDLTYDLPDELWTYRLHHNPGEGSFAYGAKSYQAGVAYNFNDTGPWAVAIDGPARIEPGEPGEPGVPPELGTYPIRLAGSTAMIEWLCMGRPSP
jgi:hypothetical protein